MPSRQGHQPSKTANGYKRQVLAAQKTLLLAAPGQLLPLSIPFTGNYNWQTAALNNRGTNGNFWSSTAYNSGDHTNAYNLNFNGSNVNPQNNNNKVNGLTIRCVAR